MDGLDDFMLYNACEDAREEEAQSSRDDSYQNLFGEERADDDSRDDDY